MAVAAESPVVFSPGIQGGLPPGFQAHRFGSPLCEPVHGWVPYHLFKWGLPHPSAPAPTVWRATDGAVVQVVEQIVGDRGKNRSESDAGLI